MPISYPEMMEQPVDGPLGSHIFRTPSMTIELDDDILTLSPITPSTGKVPSTVRSLDDSVIFSPTGELAMLLRQANGPFKFTSQPLDSSDLASWSPVMVAQSMLNAGVEFCFAEKFIDNDINGGILVTLKFEDLKELQISSFGVRTKIWNQIQILRDCKQNSPLPPTPIEDCPSDDVNKGLKRAKSSRRRVGAKGAGGLEDIISPMESVSIVGIEQVIPKPHQCAKGEACAKFRKQRRLIEAFKKEHPLADMDAGVLIAGDPGNPATAPRIDLEDFRPVSDALQSVVASSDVMGPGSLPPLQYLREATLQNLQKRDPQDNVKQFLAFQRGQNVGSNDVPPTPPFEILPTQNPHQNLRNLPKLAIPGKSPLRPPPPPGPPPQVQTQPQPQPQQQMQPRQEPRASSNFIPYTMEQASPAAEELRSANPYRFGTPFSEMDVPVTAVPLGPVARDASQSVPPDMNYRAPNPPTRSMSRSSARRPSFPMLPALDENRATPPLRISKTPSPTNSLQQPRKAPPRVNYPWSPIERKHPFETAIAPFPAVTSRSIPVKEMAPRPTTQEDGVNYQGTMRKRKTHFLRHEWQEGFFTLKGTRLAMHKDSQNTERTLEYVDIDDYAVACSSVGSQSKLSAAFKAVHLRQNDRVDKKDVGAFAFQLVPQGKDGARLRKRDSFLPGSNVGGGVAGEGVNGTGRTHHFAVKGRDERIDWMRELMLAKALKQKGEGYEVCVNGNMI